MDFVYKIIVAGSPYSPLCACNNYSLGVGRSINDRKIERISFKRLRYLEMEDFLVTMNKKKVRIKTCASFADQSAGR
jgi:hypothetical protein